MVLATPVASSATMSTQSATLSPGGHGDAAGLGASQAELPHWLRRSVAGTQARGVL